MKSDVSFHSSIRCGGYIGNYLINGSKEKDAFQLILTKSSGVNIIKFKCSILQRFPLTNEIVTVSSKLYYFQENKDKTSCVKMFGVINKQYI